MVGDRLKRVVVLGNDHTNTLGLVQTLGREGFYVIACMWGEKRGLVTSSIYCKTYYTASSPQDCIDIIIKMSIYDEDEIIPILASCDDAALILEKNRERFDKHFVFEYTTSTFTIHDLVKKDVQVFLAQQANFFTPKSWCLETIESPVPNDVEFPCIIKPLISSQGMKADIHICYSYEELLTQIKSLKVTTKVLIQQYIERDYEISILGCGLKNGEVVIPCVEQKLTLYPLYVGLECLARMMPLTDQQIISSVKSFIQDIGYVGLFSIEMMHCAHSGKFYFTEFNPRNDGANSFVYKYGVNLPQIHICDLLGETIPTHLNYKPGFYIWDFHHFMSLIHRDITLKQWFCEIKKSRGFLTIFSEDKKPFYRQYRNWILEKLKLRKIVTY